jgi:KTSC domain
MNGTAVESTTLATVTYDETQEALQLVFRSGAIYQYSGISAEVHEGLLSAASKGGYFNRFIRGRFPYRLLVNSDAGARTALRPEGPRQGRPWLEL